MLVDDFKCPFCARESRKAFRLYREYPHRCDLQAISLVSVPAPRGALASRARYGVTMHSG